MTNTWSVADINDRLAEMLEIAFPSELWVEGEISNLSRSANGHVYFQLIEPGSDRRRPPSALSVTLFDSSRKRVNLHLRRAGGAVRMEDGVRVRVRGSIELYAARGQVQFNMVAIDPAYTLGDLAAQRRKVLAALAEEGLLEANRRRTVPPLPLRLGIITSLGSAAHADVVHELEASGLGFDVHVVDARMQGLDAEITVVAALAELVRREVDLVAVVRGGGASTDLATFDSEVIARAVALCPLPVWSGVGHEVDRTIIDEVVHTAFKTPTACAAGVVGHVFSSIALLDRARARIAELATTRLTSATAHLDRSVERVRSGASLQLARSTARLDGAAGRARAYDPGRALARGWTITRRTDGSVVRSVDDVDAGESLVTTVADGAISSTVDR